MQPSIHSSLKQNSRAMTGSSSSSCGACKFLRRRCIPDCIYAPYFSYEQAAAQFAAVHKVFGASNVSKMLLHLPLHSRGDAAAMICYEALARVQDPVYGCVAHIFALQHQVAMLKEEIESIERQMTAATNFDAVGCNDQWNLCTLISADSFANQTCCTNIHEVQSPGLEYGLSSESRALEKLLQEYYLQHRGS